MTESQQIVTAATLEEFVTEHASHYHACQDCLLESEGATIYRTLFVAFGK
jgi:hypothetical protein